MSHAPLATVGTLEIAPAARRHRFYREALACAQVRVEDNLERVVGTDNTLACELYGWAPHVPEHADGFGYSYFVCLNEANTLLCLRNGEEIEAVWAPPGAIIRLDDRFPHWTLDDAPRVAAFVGTFDEPQDAAAIEVLRDGIAALARGDYYGAPRMSHDFRTLFEDECWAAASESGGAERILLADAMAQGRLIAACSICGRPAVRMDPYWPYEHRRSRCADHLNVSRNVTENSM